ncbi:hypothetical protein I0C86_33010 [Plantactinospora sp. S1510]|uniref:Uncharacterized protein n=1 Tax=Plantactinospora alkalitolerans TaxID=2789879 RepID=A0ABS0H6E4_9ACTN|nr:hypothetical protein [Plantactinospora alkalitolerans]MBF9133719.1 hypothetical protein [Plantactinospora alkalitolerans]
MTDPTRAAGVFAAELRRRGAGPIHRGGLLIAATLTELSFGLLPKPSLDDIVVTRRDDGEVLLRTAAGPMGDADDLLAHVRTQLATLSPADFVAQWGLPPNSAA